MTDKQILDIVLKRADQCAKSCPETYLKNLKNPKVVITQQYGKKLYFAIKFEGIQYPLWLKFAKNGKSIVFALPQDLPSHLMKWKHDLIKKIQPVLYDHVPYVDFDLETTPKEIVHMFSSSIISALNSSGMSMGFMSSSMPNIFDADETYEQISVEADLENFEEDYW